MGGNIRVDDPVTPNTGIGTPDYADMGAYEYTTTWDVTGDGMINVLDVILIGQHWGETGPDCWIPEDVNCDGMINVLDVILVGQHWGEGC